MPVGGLDKTSQPEPRYGHAGLTPAEAAGAADRTDRDRTTSGQRDQRRRAVVKQAADSRRERAAEHLGAGDDGRREAGDLVRVRVAVELEQVGRQGATQRSRTPSCLRRL
jgi:hypothetical protein